MPAILEHPSSVIRAVGTYATGPMKEVAAGRQRMSISAKAVIVRVFNH